VTINKIKQAFKKKKQKPLKFTRQIVASYYLKKKKTARCRALTKDIVYTLNKNELDALSNTSSFDTNELKELRDSLLT
jgi:ABC-type thiamine transport system substrate-binding protein